MAEGKKGDGKRFQVEGKMQQMKSSDAADTGAEGSQMRTDGMSIAQRKGREKKSCWMR